MIGLSCFSTPCRKPSSNAEFECLTFATCPPYCRACPHGNRWISHQMDSYSRPRHHLNNPFQGEIPETRHQIRLPNPSAAPLRRPSYPTSTSAPPRNTNPSSPHSRVPTHKTQETTHRTPMTRSLVAPTRMTQRVVGAQGASAPRQGHGSGLASERRPRSRLRLASRNCCTAWRDSW